MKGVLVDVRKQEVRLVEFANLRGLQALVEGHIEAAYAWPTGDIMYVNEEGMNWRLPLFYFAYRQDQALHGNAVVVGKEFDDPESEDSYRTRDPIITPDQLRKLVSFSVRFLI